MSLDANGNYRVSIPFPPVPVAIGSKTIPVFGVPASSVGSDGDIAIDLTSGTVYSKEGGTWNVITASLGTGLQAVVYTSGTPPDPPDETKPAVAYDSTGNLPTRWWSTSNQQWT